MAEKGKTGDRVYTPRWCADDMVRHFRPSGRILDPCRGQGVFTELIRGALWCEIDDGRDFFHWSEEVDWVIGNPPYSLTREWFRHSYRIAKNIAYLVPLRNLFSGYGFVREILNFGGIREIRLYGTGGRLGFPMGNAVGAVWVQRDYRGPTTWSDHMSDELFAGNPKAANTDPVLSTEEEASETVTLCDSPPVRR